MRKNRDMPSKVPGVDIGTYPSKFHYQGNGGVTYDLSRMSSSNWRREVEVVRSLVAELVSGTSILDVPFGMGRFLRGYEETEHQVIGLDISRDMLLRSTLRKAPSSIESDLVTGDPEHLPLADSSVDYVVCMGLLNWVPLPNLKKMIGEFVRVSRRGLILGIRVRRPMPIVQLLGRGSADALRLYPWAKMLFNPVRTVARSLKREWQHYKGEPVGSPEPGSGYSFHNESTILGAFDELGLLLDQQDLVEARISYRNRELQPYFVYVLKPWKCGENKLQVFSISSNCKRAE